MTEFTIPGELPTANEVIAALNTQRRYIYSNIKKDYTALVMIRAQRLKKVEKADFEITWYCKDRRKDKDNLMFGQKFIFDGLVKAGIIKNDGWAQIGDVSHKFVVDKGNPRVEVKIIELDSYADSKVS